MTQSLIERDKVGPFLVVGLDRKDKVMEALSLAGVRFSEGDPDECGCGGPSLALFRFVEPLDEVALNRLLRKHGVR